MQLEIEWEGASYTYDAEMIDYATAAEIKRAFGYGLKSWNKAVDDMDPDALCGLMYALKVQNGERMTPISKCQVDPVRFYNTFLSATTLAMNKQLSERAGEAQKKTQTSSSRRTPTPTSKKSDA